MSHSSCMFVHTLFFCHFSDELEKSREEIKKLKEEMTEMENMLGDI